MKVYAPRVSLVEAPAAGILLVGIEHDHEDGRGGMLRLSHDALALLPEALAEAIAAHQAGDR